MNMLFKAMTVLLIIIVSTTATVLADTASKSKITEQNFSLRVEKKYTCPASNPGNPFVFIAIHDVKINDNGEQIERRSISWQHFSCNEINTYGFGWLSGPGTTAEVVVPKDGKRPRAKISEFSYTGDAAVGEGKGTVRVKKLIVAKFKPYLKALKKGDATEVDYADCSIIESSEQKDRFEKLVPRAKGGLQGLIKLTVATPEEGTKSILIDLANSKIDINTEIVQRVAKDEKRYDNTLRKGCPVTW